MKQARDMSETLSAFDVIAEHVATPSHPFTPDVVAWAEVDRWDDGPDVTISATFARKLSRQIIAAVGRV